MSKLIVILLMVSTLVRAGMISDTGMYVATSAIPTYVAARMAVVSAQVKKINDELKERVLEATKQKEIKLLQIRDLEAQILLELQNIKANQEILNKIEVIK